MTDPQNLNSVNVSALNFAEYLTELLRTHDRDAAWLARTVEKSPSTVARWLNNASGPSDAETINRIADAFKLKGDDRIMLFDKVRLRKLALAYEGQGDKEGESSGAANPEFPTPEGGNLDGKGFFFPVGKTDEEQRRIASQIKHLWDQGVRSPFYFMLASLLILFAIALFLANNPRAVQFIKSILNPPPVPTPIVLPEAQSLIDQGYQLVVKGDHESAIAYYNRAIALSPTYAKTYHLRASSYNALKKYDLAVADYTQSIKLSPDNAGVYNDRGTAYLAQSQLNLGIGDFTTAIKLNPALAAPYFNRSTAYFRLGNLNGVIKDLSSVIEIQPDYPFAYYNRGNMYFRLKNYALAIEDYSKTLELVSDHDTVRHISVEDHPRLQNENLYTLTSNEVVKLEFNLDDVYQNRADAYYALEEYSTAISDYDKAIALNSNNAFLFNNRGNAHLKLGEHERSIADLTEAIRLTSNFANAYRNRAIVYYEQGIYDKALADYINALEAHNNLSDTATIRLSDANLLDVQQRIKEIEGRK